MEGFWQTIWHTAGSLLIPANHNCTIYHHPYQQLAHNMSVDTIV